MKHIKKENSNKRFKFPATSEARHRRQVSSFMNGGFIFLEILIATALIGVVFITLLSIGALALNISFAIQQTTKADSLIKEEIEALRSFRNSTNWATNGLGTVNFTSSNPYYLALDNSLSPAKWNLNSGNETTGVFTRKIVFDRVSRNPSTNNIEETYNPLNNDPDTIKVTVSVAWSDKKSEVVTYLTNWQ